ncbi:MAG: PEP/pyruvate-binding domain-containing protein, partial [Acidimicrobiales bacterium]
MEFVRWFDQIRLADADVVGGKGANLGEMTAGGLPVPPGYVVTADAYRYALTSTGIVDKLAEVVAVAPDASQADLSAAAHSAQDLIRSIVLPVDLAGAVLDAYHRLGKATVVAVRSSGTSEDGGDTSFAGMNATLTNVTGDAELLDALVECWASLYGARVIYYRATRGLSDTPAMGVIVQEMVPSERSGVALDNQKRFAEAGTFHSRALTLAPRSNSILDKYASHLLVTGDEAGA